MNSVSVEFLNRANDYNVEIAEDKDDAMIAVYGLRKASPKQAHAITSTTVAKQVANFLRKREVEIRATYTFTLGWQFNLLEPMDLVRLTVPELGYNQKPVRITAIRENDNGQLEIDAEDFPYGTASPTLYPQQSPGGFVPQANADPGNVNTPIVFEAPFLMSRSGQHEIWMAVSGGALVNLLLYSEQFDNAVWANSSTTVTANAATDPLGGVTADAVAYSVAGTNAFIVQFVTPSTPVANQTFTFSCWVKTPSGTNSANLLIEDQTGAVIVNTAFPITSSWQRFSVTGTMGPSATSVRVFVYNLATAGTLHLWGAQLENSSSMSSYAMTTSLPARVANPNWGGCHVWVSQDNTEYRQVGQIFGPARMGVLTGTATSRTNLLTFSDQFDNAAWVKDGSSTISANIVTAPNNTATADVFVKGGGTFSDWAHLEQHVSGNMSGQSWTFSIWMRVASGSLSGVSVGLSDFNLLSKFSASQTVTSTWQRFSFTAGGFNNTGFIAGGIVVPGVAGTQVQVWGAQLEQSAAMTPYIPTTNASASVSSLVNSGGDPDVTNYFPVDLGQSNGTLQSGTQADADSYRTLCYAGGEFVAFQSVNLTGANKYNAGRDGAAGVYLRRGLFGTTITTHAPGEVFARLDDSIFTYVYDPAFIGKPIYLKFTSFNTSGLMEQSIANATAYQFVIAGRYLQNESISKNMLDNPGFESNAALTLVNSSISNSQVGTIAYGQRVSDGWTAYDLPTSGIYASGSGLFSIFLEQASVSHGGAGNILVRLNQSVAVSSGTAWRGTGVRSDYIPIKPGEAYAWGGWVRWDSSAVLPANTQGVTAIRNHLFDSAFNYLGELNASNSVEGGSLSANSGGAWKRTDSYATIPAAFGGGKPQYMAVVALAYVLNTTGSTFNTGANNYIDARFDDVYCFPQWSPTGNEIGKQGSLSNTYTGGLSYTSNTSSITWSWNLNASRTDSALTVNNYTGSQAVTSLASGTAYNFYPFIDELAQIVTMVATSGVGSPTWAHSGTSIAWTQEQARGDHFPLSSAPVVASTTTTGSGGGSGGGIGGSCLREDVLVREKTKGVIKVRDLVVGDWISCPPDDDTPDGWAEVSEVVKNCISREWVHTSFNVDDWLVTTPGHPFTLEDGSMKRAAQLCFEDPVPCATGITFPVTHALEIYCATKVSVTIRSARHVFYAGMKSPCILQHNVQPFS
jgi:hypothetical protein